MRGAISPFPSTPSWRGAQLRKTEGQLYFLHLLKLNIYVRLIWSLGLYGLVQWVKFSSYHVIGLSKSNTTV